MTENNEMLYSTQKHVWKHHVSCNMSCNTGMLQSFDSFPTSHWQTRSPSENYCSSLQPYDKEKLPVFTFKMLKPANVWHTINRWKSLMMNFLIIDLFSCLCFWISDPRLSAYSSENSPHCYHNVTVPWLNNEGWDHRVYQGFIHRKTNISTHSSGQSTTSPIPSPPLPCFNPQTDWCVFAEMRYPTSLSPVCWQHSFFTSCPHSMLQ